MTFQCRYAVVQRISVVILLVHASSQAAELNFNRDIRPILSNNCFACHGPDAANRQADLRLDTDESKETVVSELVARITADDSNDIMPPPESHKALTDEEIDILKRWVQEGAPYDVHWSFKPIRQAKIRSVDGPAIDQLVQQRLHSHGLEFAPEADRRTLIRRLTLDLTGLPPTMGEIVAFLADDSPDAYQKVVDRLLHSRHYGEQMARYWLDLVRFADTNGLHHDHYREMTPYRDWVIRSFNENLPFDEFVIAQIAGDLLEQPSQDQLIASGFNRLHLIIDVGTALPEESHHRNVVDRVSAVGTAFLGLTLQCAVCHDHKYDPITQREFYQLYAFFNNFDGDAETGGRETLDFRRGLQAPYLELPTEKQKEQRSRLERQISEICIEIEEAKQTSDQALTPQPDEDGRWVALERKRDELESARDELVVGIPAALVMRDRSDVRPTHVLIRGNYDNPGDLVDRNVPAFLPRITNSNGENTRLDLARWIVDPDNPLTARVTVNRFWQQFFGVGLVETAEDFGAQGTPPSHPELLDLLALRFVDSDWNVKSLVRELVLSRTYRQSSSVSAERYISDPRNRLLARGARFRLDGEIIRDQLLSVSGLLNAAMYGKSVKPPQPEGLWKSVTMPTSSPNAFTADEGEKIYRRSIYTFWKRGMPPPQLTIFDAPTRESCVARRERTNTPLQALVLMNEQQYFMAAMKYAHELLQEPGFDDRQRIEIAYEEITCQQPSAATVRQAQTALESFRELYRDQRDDAAQMMEHLGGQNVGEEIVQSELAAWTMVVHAMFNLEITRTRY